MKEKDPYTKKGFLNLKEVTDPEINIIAKVLEVLFCVLTVYLLTTTILIPVNSGVSRLYIYIRNGVTMLSWLSLSLYFQVWPAAHNNTLVEMKQINTFTRISVIVAIVAVIKAIMSIVNLFFYFNYPNVLILIYYIGEAMAWFALSFFFVYYAFRRVYRVK